MESEVVKTCGGVRSCGAVSTNRVRLFTRTWTCEDDGGVEITSDDI